MILLRRLFGPVRMRITLAAVLILGVALTAAGFALVELQRRALIDGVDSSLRLRADDLVAQIADGSLPPDIPVSDEEVALVQVIGPSGEIEAASENIAGAPPVIGARPRPGDTPIVGVDALPIDDEPFRVLARTARTGEGDYTILIAGSLDDIDESSEVLAGILRVVVPGVVLLAGAGVWWLVGGALAPVEAIRASVATLSASDLHRRVPEPATEDEVGRLARTMNEMLARIEDAYERQEQFVADAAHELRSPLAALRADLEVDLRSAEPGSAEQSGRLLSDVVRMQRLVDDLLAVARGTNTAGAGERPLIDFDDVVLAEVRRTPHRERVALDASGVSAAAVRGDPDQLARAVRNLLENAARHAASRVTVSLAEARGTATLTIEDDGPGIPADARERIFERFARLDDSRARETGGAGLGLAITRRIIEEHGGRIALDPGYAAGARFIVTLPATAD